MDFIDEIMEQFKKVELENLPYKIYLMGNRGAIIYNVKDIGLMTDTQIVLNLKKNKLNIIGINLYLKSFQKGEIFVCGKILKMEILE